MAKEYVSKEFTKLLEYENIKHELTVLYISTKWHGERNQPNISRNDAMHVATIKIA